MFNNIILLCSFSTEQVKYFLKFNALLDCCPSVRMNTYHFDVFPRAPFTTFCVFQYPGQTIIPNHSIESIARNILAQATKLWIQGQEQCLDPQLNLETLKNVLIEQDDKDLLPWLEPFTSLSIQNDQSDPYHTWNRVVIRLE